MNRNVSIVVVILVLVVIAGYLVWLRSRYQSPIVPETIVEQEIVVTPSPISTASASATPAATSSGKEASGSTKTKSATSGSTKK